MVSHRLRSVHPSESSRRFATIPLSALTVFLLVAGGGIRAAQAQAQLYAIGEDLWRFDIASGGATATATKIRDFNANFWTGGGGGNSLAFDDVHNQLIFGDGLGRTLYSYNLTTSTLATLGTLTLTGYDLTQYNLYGSASFYNGKYYVLPELINGQSANSPANQPYNFWVEVNLNGAGTGIASTAILGGTTAAPDSQWGANVSNGFGDGGDLAIDGRTGKVYGFSSATTNPTGTTSIAGFYTANVNTPTSGVTVVDATLTGGQAALQSAGAAPAKLYRNNGNTSIQERNTGTGALVNTYTLTGFNDTNGISDLASASAIPEPGSGSLALLGMGGLPLLGYAAARQRRHRRRARK